MTPRRQDFLKDFLFRKPKTERLWTPGTAEDGMDLYATLQIRRWSPKLHPYTLEDKVPQLPSSLGLRRQHPAYQSTRMVRTTQGTE